MNDKSNSNIRMSPKHRDEAQEGSVRSITVDGSPRKDEPHQEGVRRRLLYIHEEIKIYCNLPMVSSDT